jgi:hypothetical protein
MHTKTNAHRWHGGRILRGWWAARGSACYLSTATAASQWAVYWRGHRGTFAGGAQ